ncbi:MAG: hypothetical protein UT63_C0019G0023 [Candidatus Gottesmanbacteria bacterium GW2011_GWC2_39_8]|uniref:EamA domain-containing protein n=1 Tax=Candidatus Gottesmanbacteria bacterium GW2011_GWC2_39_8 TaxID=1618450 RepID=A0A0G0Q7J4_9BACT|nr:MAG: hypothetical protein UT63_C0019G0023 [Candidatus Gottesmanbacteria bacterium GW2011_GWC2_39_8]
MKNKGIIYLVFAGVCYGIMGLLIRLLNNQIPPFAQVFLRYVVAFSLACLFAIQHKTNLKMNSVKDYIVMFSIGILGYGLTNALFTLSVINTTLANAEFLFSTFIIMTPLLGIFLLKERPGKFLWSAVILATFGTYLLFKPSGTNGIQGEIFALIAAVFTSLYYIGSRNLKKYSAITLMVYSTLSGVISVGLISLLTETSFFINTSNQSITSVSPFTWLIVLFFGADNFLAWLFLNKGFQTVKAGVGSIILLLEPIIGTLTGIIIYKEYPVLATILGIFAILGAIILVIKEEK